MTTSAGTLLGLCEGHPWAGPEDSSIRSQTTGLEMNVSDSRFPLAHDIGEDVQGVGGVAGVLAMPTNSVQRVPRPRNVWCSAWVGGELALWHTGARGLSEGVSDSRFFTACDVGGEVRTVGKVGGVFLAPDRSRATRAGPRNAWCPALGGGEVGERHPDESGHALHPSYG